MTPRSIAPAPTSGAPVPSTSTLPAAPSGPHRPRPQLGGPGRLAPRAREARVVPADLRPALLPAVAVAGRARRHRGVPDQVRTGRRVAPRAGPHHQGQALGRFRRRLRLGERGPAAGPARKAARPGSTSSPACGATPGCTPCPRPRCSAPRGSGDRRSSRGVSDWPRRARGAGGRRSGRSGPPSSTDGSGRSAGRRSSACGGYWGGRCRSRRSSPPSRDTRSGSPW